MWDQLFSRKHIQAEVNLSKEAFKPSGDIMISFYGVLQVIMHVF